MKKYPKRIYVHRENEGTTDEFFDVAEDLNHFATIEKRAVGVYELVKTGRISLIVNYEED